MLAPPAGAPLVTAGGDSLARINLTPLNAADPTDLSCDTSNCYLIP